MVVDHIEHDRQTELVRSVDEGTKVVRGAIQPRGCVRKYTVVSPPELAGKLRHRHRLDDRDAKTRELGQLPDRKVRVQSIVDVVGNALQSVG